MALFKTITINLHCPDEDVDSDDRIEAISNALDNIPLVDILRNVVEQKVAEQSTTKILTVTVHED